MRQPVLLAMESQPLKEVLPEGWAILWLQLRLVTWLWLRHVVWPWCLVLLPGLSGHLWHVSHHQVGGLPHIQIGTFHRRGAPRSGGPFWGVPRPQLQHARLLAAVAEVVIAMV